MSIQMIDLGSVVDPSKDIFPTTGAHLDIRVTPQFGDKKGQRVNPRFARSLLQNLRIGEQGQPLVEQRGDGIWAWNYGVSSEFGPREAPAPGASTYHEGIDVMVPANTQLRYKGAGTYTPGQGKGTLRTTDAQGNPYDIELLHTVPGTEASVAAIDPAQNPLNIDTTTNQPMGTTLIQRFDMRPESKEKKEDKGYGVKDYMKGMILQSMLDPMAGTNFLGGYTMRNPSLAGMMQANTDMFSL